MEQGINISPKVKKGDRIVCVIMGDESSISFGDAGTVTAWENVGNWTQIRVKWDNGSQLSLILEDDPKQQKDVWMLEEDFINKFGKEMINESMELGDMEKLSDIYGYFGGKSMDFFYEYLEKLRESGIINMFQAAPYLWMGKARIENEQRYRETNEAFDELLDMADESQRRMINGVINYLENNNKEVSVENINRFLNRLDGDIISFWMRHDRDMFR